MKDVVRRGNFVLDIIHLSTKIPVRDVIHKMATEGVLGLILIQWRCARDRLVTLHTFINGSKTKEYDGISVEAATYIMQKERSQSSQIPGAPAYVCRTRPQMKFKPEPPEPLHDDNRQAELGKNLGLISNLSSILMSINEMRAGSTDGKNSLLDLLKDIQRKRQYETQGIPADIPNSGLGFNPNDLQNLHLNKNLIDADAARNPLLQNELQLLSSSAQARAQTDPSNANIDALRLSYALIQALNAQGDRPNNLPSDQSLIHGQPAQRGASSLYSDAIGPQLRAPAPIPNLNNVANTAIHTPPVQQPIPPNYRPNDHFEGPGGAPQVLNPQIPQPGQPQAANPPQGSVVSVLERLKKLYQTQTQSKETRAFM